MPSGALNGYLQQTQRLLGDQTEVTWNAGDLIAYINEGREQIALESGCCRGTPQDLFTQTGVEIYPFSNINVSAFPGAKCVFSVGTVSIQWGTFQYTVRRMSYSRYQAQVRNYANSYQDLPSIGTQVGDGANGAIYLYPFANDVYQMFWDCFFLPLDLNTNLDFEIIPVPWTTAIQYYAAFKALSSVYSGRMDEASMARTKLADRNFSLYKQYIKRARAGGQQFMVSNWYGRR